MTEVCHVILLTSGVLALGYLFVAGFIAGLEWLDERVTKKKMRQHDEQQFRDVARIYFREIQQSLDRIEDKPVKPVRKR